MDLEDNDIMMLLLCGEQQLGRENEMMNNRKAKRDLLETLSRDQGH